MKPTIPNGIRRAIRQVGMIRTMEKGSRKAKAVKERKLEKAFRPLATKAWKKVLSRPPEKESQGRARKARRTSVRKPRMERLPPQRLIVHHGMTNLTNHIRNVGTAVEPAGTPRMVFIGVNGPSHRPATSSWKKSTKLQKVRITAF